MIAVWNSAGPILLLQLLIAFVYLGGPIIRRSIEALGAFITRYLPEPPSEQRVERKTEQPFRGKWREASYTRQDAHEKANDTPPPPARFSERDGFLKTLGLSDSVSKSDLKRRYRKLAKTYHPDQFAAAHHSAASRQEAAEKMLAINEAYDWLVENPRA